MVSSTASSFGTYEDIFQLAKTAKLIGHFCDFVTFMNVLLFIEICGHLSLSYFIFSCIQKRCQVNKALEFLHHFPPNLSPLNFMPFIILFLFLLMLFSHLKCLFSWEGMYVCKFLIKFSNAENVFLLIKDF